MIIHEVNEFNFSEEIKKGELQVNEKFARWDQLQKLDIKLNEYKDKAAYMMRDPTIWAYATLKDKENEPLRPYYFQDNLMNDRHRFVHITAANQIGKTWGAGIIKGAHHAMHVNNASVMLISRSEGQAKGILDEIKWMFKRSRMEYELFIDEVANRFEYHMKSPDGIGTSVIRVFPPTPAILSFPATLIIMDETGFWEKQTDLDPIEYYQQCVEPRTNTTKNWKHPFLTMGQIVSITNPNGQDGLAWWLYEREKYHNYVYNWLANPNNTLEEYRQAERDLPPIRFASVYAAKYLMASGGFISLAQYERFKSYKSHLAIPPGNLFLGGDFASEEPKSKNTDWNTLYGVVHVPNKAYPQNPRIRVVYRKDFAPRTKREVIYNEIERIKKLPGVYIPKFGYDKVGVGDSVKNDLIGRGILNLGQVEPLTYSLPNKSEVYLNLQALFHQDMIEGTDIPKLREQILALKVEQPTGSVHIKVHHKTSGVKDDEPDALANACYVAKNFFSYSRSSFIQKKVEASPKSFEDYLETNMAKGDFGYS
jgi:hypothetical protein